jgi:hypothetical protein
MNAEPTIPKTCFTPLAARVSTKASDGPIFCGWLTDLPLHYDISIIETLHLLIALK